MFYQREDLKHPGKVLAIFPPSGDTKKDISFIALPKGTSLIEDVIRSQVIKNNSLLAIFLYTYFFRVK